MEESCKRDAGEAFKLSNHVKFEICIVCKGPSAETHRSQILDMFKGNVGDAVHNLIQRLQQSGLFVEQEDGLNMETFIKIGAPEEVIGRTAEKVQLRKVTYLGLDVIFDWHQRDAFTRQPFENSLFSWTERYQCLQHLIQTVRSDSDIKLPSLQGEAKDIEVKSGEALVPVLKSAGVIVDIFPLHDEEMRKELLRNWALKWKDVTSQPIDAIYTYFGAKVAIYFAFLGMYTQWLMFPAILAIFFSFINLGKFEPVVPLIFSFLVVVWAVLLLQFWKRKNAAILTRWDIIIPNGESCEMEFFNHVGKQTLSGEGTQKDRLPWTEVTKSQKQVIQKLEWLEQLKTFRNIVIVVTGILCFQLPFELTYVHLNEVLPYNILKYALTGLYLSAIRYFTKIGGKIAVKLTKTEHYSNMEAESDSLIYKVFGIYFMQSYIGLFYHALLHRDFGILRQFLLERLVVSEVMNLVMENLVPYLSYRWAKHKALRWEKEQTKLSKGSMKPQASRTEKEYLKPSYASSIGNNILEDGLFDDFLELALQFGMVTMFACSFPLVFAFIAVINLIEIRSDSLKLLAIRRRPIPHIASSIGAWLNIFQYIGVVAICTNCALLVCLYDQAGRWKIEPGLAAILIVEHLLLLAKFGFSCFVPEEPAWVKAKRMKRAQVQDYCSLQLLRSLDAKRKTA
ncbi:hypothetical protein O6H91_17G043000 [Diphasiastrum complanatum]|nr:hypothetical protein O6H91_17G043000 [Diphasiastrum complanatum]KAJ7525234.1 hypothetical protein O6H91_17G043000 [Diphasiastrum complanatum]KAJ7525237.1 hypothetical protein O6H91_17G043000 [Diphasiastrum complanatum]KAJ7525238.1 hypothetical protein O6H91_17G043000 [Diphasiastrum complanatum]